VESDPPKEVGMLARILSLNVGLPGEIAWQPANGTHRHSCPQGVDL